MRHWEDGTFVMNLSTTADQASYRQAIAMFATGVTVITTTIDGEPAGMTASAVCSLSLDPILLLVCIYNRLPTHRALESSGCFVVNVLAEDQEWLARRFATPQPDKFAGLALREGFGLPVLADAMAYFVCEVAERFPGGDHSIFTGRVTACGREHDQNPLLYFGSQFGSLEDRAARFARAGYDPGLL